MKAKEIYAKYRLALFEVPDGREMKISKSGKVVHIPKTDDEYDGVLQQLWRELVDELNALLKQRKAGTDKAFLGAVNEINDKYNAVGELFIRDFGWSPLLRNGFRTELLNMVNAKLSGKEEKANES